MITGKLVSTVATLTAQRVPFAIATVVRASRPTSARPGDSAVVLADGTIDGFVGGVCAESTVRLYSLRAMETGEPLLLKLVPGEGDGDGSDIASEVEGAVVEHNPCLSGGALEIFIEPQLPAARLIVVGSAPIAVALAEVAAAAGYDVIRAETGESVEPSASDAAVVVAAHGSDEERVLSAALAAGVPYVGLVASPRRGTAVVSELDVPAELRAQLKTPAGLDIGARTPADVAISILAEMIERAHAHPADVAPPSAARSVTAATAVDPVCGMTVAAAEATVHLDVPGGERVYFCGTGCRTAYPALEAKAD